MKHSLWLPLLLVSALSHAADYKPLPQPDDAAAVAWFRCTDGEGYENVPYYFLGSGDMRVTFDVRPKSGQAVELFWGSKNDQRVAIVQVNGASVDVKAGGWKGFRWLRVPVPEGGKGERTEVVLKAGEGGRAAFIGEVRLTAPGGDPKRVDLKQPAYKVKNVNLSAQGGRHGQAAAPAEAFPEMRKMWDSEPSTSTSTDVNETLFRRAEKNARCANEAFYRSRRYIDGWLAHADPETGLFPRNLGPSNYWNGRDSGADNYPFMVLTASMTDRSLMEGRLLEILRTETRLTCRVDRLPDDYSLATHTWRREKVNLDEIIFDGAEYVKDGLLYIAEWLGRSPWSERMIGIVDDIWKNATIDTPYGKIPTLNLEVNGDLLQSCSRLYWFTGERKYLDWSIRLGDYYLLGTNHITRSMTKVGLSDHACEVINGLSELYFAVSLAAPEKQKAYREPLHEIYDCILKMGRNEDGLLYTWFNPKTGEHANSCCDTWGYNLDGFYTMWLVDKTEAYRDAVRKALSNLKGKYVGACWADKSADGFADSIEGAINLFNREFTADAEDWVESQIRMMWAKQHTDGVIEGWHGDGNFARTSLMYALWRSAGVTIEPWRPDVRVGAVRDGGKVYLSLISDKPWTGRVIFDKQRHKLHMHLPMDYPRINQFPEWFTAKADNGYTLSDVTTGKTSEVSGKALINGMKAELAGGREVRWVIEPAK